ncbi:MAG: hypothetical protein ACMZI0_19560 [Symbiopectobacterium sp.]|uniref:hypothetical protein n=1 Tax=Symbiopectobacterium sp. TaxID=2952789 RepID=UPI0039EA3542
MPQAPEAMEYASALAEVGREGDAYQNAEALSEAEHAALAAYLRQFQTSEGWQSEKVTRTQRSTKHMS